MTTPNQELVPLRDAGVDLDDSAALGTYDLAGMRAAVAARTGPGGGGGGTTAATAVGVAASVLVLAGLGGWAALSSVPPKQTPPEALVAANTPAPQAAPAVVRAEPVREAPVAAPVVAPATCVS